MPDDSARKLAVKGLRAKHRGKGLQIFQPCPAHSCEGCRVYEERPERCRSFVCRQLDAALKKTISTEDALERIAEARQLVDDVQSQLAQSGDSRTHKPLQVRVAAVLTPPFSESDVALQQRDSLREANRKLESFLAEHFRVDSAGDDFF